MPTGLQAIRDHRKTDSNVIACLHDSGRRSIVVIGGGDGPGEIEWRCDQCNLNLLGSRRAR